MALHWSGLSAVVEGSIIGTVRRSLQRRPAYRRLNSYNNIAIVWEIFHYYMRPTSSGNRGGAGVSLAAFATVSFASE